MSSHYLQNYANSGLYTMQGRVSPPEDGQFQCFPRNSWEREIELLAQSPLRGIEWIYDGYGLGANPLESDTGRATLIGKLASSGISVKSLCADYFMDYPLGRGGSEQREHSKTRLLWLISACSQVGISRIVIPFVDSSRIKNNREMTNTLDSLHSIIPIARESAVELHLETDFGPKEFSAFLREIQDPVIKVNYDSGNSSSLGFSPAEEFAAYGDRVGSFHIKDRVRGGATVPLGQGDTDFQTLRSCLIDVDYSGDFVLQVARGLPGKELEWLKVMHDWACKWLTGEITYGEGH